MLTIRRARDNIGVLRRMKVLVDGQLLGRLRPGEHVEVDLPPGSHVVQARMDWSSSRRLAIEITEAPTTVEVEMPVSSVIRFFSKAHGSIDISIAGEFVDEQERIARARRERRALILLFVVPTILISLAMAAVILVAISAGR